MNVKIIAGKLWTNYLNLCFSRFACQITVTSIHIILGMIFFDHFTLSWFRFFLEERKNLYKELNTQSDIIGMCYAHSPCKESSRRNKCRFWEIFVEAREEFLNLYIQSATSLATSWMNTTGSVNPVSEAGFHHQLVQVRVF